MPPIKVSPAKTERKFLEESDKRYGSEGTYVDIRKATVGDHEQRYELFKTLTEKTSPDGTRSVDYSMPLYELMWLEFQLCLAGTNIEVANPEDPEGPGIPVCEFKDGRVANPEKMRKEFSKFHDPLLTREIHEKIHEVNPQWKLGPNNENLGE